MKLLFIPLAILAAWLLYPSLNPVPLEGFSAAIIGLGVHLAQGDMLAFDRLQPLHVEFYGLSKLGAILGVAGLVKLFGIDGETALRILMLLGEAALLVSTFILARRWAGAPPLVAALAVLLVPGVIENSFFYADNVVAAGFTSLAFVCFGMRSAIVAPLIGGALFGLGVLTRPDIVFAGVAVPLLIVLQHGLTRHGMVALLAAIAGGAIAWLGPLLLMGVTPLDILKVGKLTLQLWDRQVSYPRHIRELVVFVGLPAGLLATLGVVALIRQRAFLRLAFLLVPIVVINAAFAGSLWQSRALLGMAPFVVALTAIGLLQLVPQPGTGRVGLWARGAAAAAIALMLLVPMKPAYDDGPHHLLGRIPGIVDWRDWQDGVAAEVAAIGDIAAANRPGLRVIISDSWNPDRYLHVALIEAGYRAQRPAEIEPACVAIAESFERDGARVLHVRLFQGFVKYYPALIRERFETMARPCLDAVAPIQTTLLTTADFLALMQGKADLAELWLAQPASPFDNLLRRLFTDKPWPIVVVPVDAGMADGMSRAYAIVEDETRTRFAAMGSRPPGTAAEAIEATRRIIPFPRGD
ncbi:hypothetical protein [Blastochloris sulfoviridis]|uniref:Glycosyltransferase RgtA/B/C/D-like domain-containing protein n=1 Tax=Blastochloris sulfoviridis TaxID=50712 RepID=A0A5M6I402_9HYPH|nr:hypothetical protein [Blastochloris sulfoviridis]KAA5602525.1 hypothetical protein F1193_04995 [Blastochloris sulfoviridis]